jgi:hypothetical protein
MYRAHKDALNFCVDYCRARAGPSEPSSKITKEILKADWKSDPENALQLRQHSARQLRLRRRCSSVSAARCSCSFLSELQLSQRSALQLQISQRAAAVSARGSCISARQLCQRTADQSARAARQQSLGRAAGRTRRTHQ